MRSEKVEKTVYITEDGMEFFNKGDAKAHEENLKYWDKLKDLEVEGPDYTPFDNPRLLSYSYRWYKVESPDDVKKLKEALSSIGKRRLVILPEIKKFPDYVAYSQTMSVSHVLSEMIKLHDENEEKWKAFIKEFENT